MVRYLAIVSPVLPRDDGLVVPRVLRYFEPNPLSAVQPAVGPETNGDNAWCSAAGVRSCDDLTLQDACMLASFVVSSRVFFQAGDTVFTWC